MRRALNFALFRGGEQKKELKQRNTQRVFIYAGAQLYKLNLYAVYKFIRLDAYSGLECSLTAYITAGKWSIRRLAINSGSRSVRAAKNARQPATAVEATSNVSDAVCKTQFTHKKKAIKLRMKHICARFVWVHMHRTNMAAITALTQPRCSPLPSVHGRREREIEVVAHIGCFLNSCAFTAKLFAAVD